MNKWARIILSVVGVASLISAAFGLSYSLLSLTACLRGAFPPRQETPYFFHAFYAMSGINILCYLVLVYCGVAFLRRSVRRVWLFVSLMIFEVVYFFGVTSFFFLWLPRFRLSVAGAYGVANGGLMIQFVILFPAWGSVLALWAKRRLQGSV